MASYLGIIEQTDELIGHLKKAFIAHSHEGSVRKWLHLPATKSVLNLCRHSEAFRVRFREHAAGPFTNKSPFRRALSAFVFMETAPAGSVEEQEATAQFLDQIRHVVKDNNRKQRSNRMALDLLFVASRLEHTRGLSGLSSTPARDASVIEAMPDIIDAAATHDPLVAVEASAFPLTSCNCAGTVNGAFCDVVHTHANRIIDDQKQELAVVAKVITTLALSSAFIFGDDLRVNKLKNSWIKGMDRLHFAQSGAAVDLARAVSDAHTPAHPSIKRAASHVAANYQVCVPPEEYKPESSAPSLVLALGSQSKH